MISLVLSIRSSQHGLKQARTREVARYSFKSFLYLPAIVTPDADLIFRTRQCLHSQETSTRTSNIRKMPNHKIERSEPAYHDLSKPIDERVSDLIGRMTLAKKAGQLFHNMLMPGLEGCLAPENPSFGIRDTRHFLADKHIIHFNLIGPVKDPLMIAKWQNAIQEFALTRTRLGIPITFSIDPRNHFTENIGSLFAARNISL